MKQPKKLTREIKECCSAHGLDWKLYLFLKETDDSYVLIGKADNQQVVLDKKRRRKRGI